MSSLKKRIRPKRIPIQYDVQFGTHALTTANLSESGCYIASDSEPGVNSDSFHLEGEAGFELECKARVVWTSANGFGVEFQGLTLEDRRRIKHFISCRFNLRYMVVLPATWQSDGRMELGIVHDLSKRGCYIAAPNALVVTGQPGRIQIRVPGYKKMISGRVVWKNPYNDYEKPAGFGIEFNRDRRRVLRHLIHQYGKSKPAR